MSRRSRHGEKECDFCRRRLACQGVAARTDSRPGFALTRFAVAVSAAARRRLAGATGLEPATYGVTGRHSNQLSYAPAGARGAFGPARRRADVRPTLGREIGRA